MRKLSSEFGQPQISLEVLKRNWNEAHQPGNWVIWNQIPINWQYQPLFNYIIHLSFEPEAYEVLELKVAQKIKMKNDTIARKN